MGGNVSRKEVCSTELVLSVGVLEDLRGITWIVSAGQPWSPDMILSE